MLVEVIVILLTLIPAYVNLNNYRKTKIIDYLIFALIFIGSGLSIIFGLLAYNDPQLIYYQLQFAMGNTAIFFIFIHANRIFKEYSNSLKFYIVIIWFAIIEGLILLWETMEQLNSAKVLFWTVNSKDQLYHPLGAGIEINDTVIYSSSYTLFSDFFQLFVAIVFLMNYMRVTAVVKTAKIERAKRLWIFAAILYLIYSVIILPWLYPSNESLILVLLVFVVIAYISITIPEGALISNLQLRRIYELIEKIQKDESEAVKQQLSISSLVTYLENIPLNEIKKTNE